MIKNCENGRSMIEMLGVLAVIGVLSVGSMAGYSKMIGQYRINTVLQQIQMIASKLSALGSSGGSYANLSAYTAYRLGALPAEIIESITEVSGNKQATLTNVYGGNITIEAASITAGTCESGTCDNQAYIITYDGLSDVACTALGGNTWNSSNNSSFLGFGIGATANVETIKGGLTQDCDGTSETGYAYACHGATAQHPIGIPLDFDDVTKACTCGTNGCSLVIKFF